MGDWMMQITWNLLGTYDGFLTGQREITNLRAMALPRTNLFHRSLLECIDFREILIAVQP